MGSISCADGNIPMRSFITKFGFPLVLSICWFSSISMQLQSKDIDNFNQSSIAAAVKSIVYGRLMERDLTNRHDNYKYHREYTIYYQEKKPNITIRLFDMKVLRDEQAIFVCASIGNPVPRIRWLVNENENLPRRYSIINVSAQKSVLKLSRAEARDNRSRITCQSTSPMGSASSYASLSVYRTKIDLPPGFPNLTSKSSVIVNEKNSRVVLECNVKGVPKPFIIWFKESVPVDLENPRLRLLDSGSLEINKTLEEDDAAYECMASNKHGSIVSPVIRLMIREDIEATYRMLMRTVSYFAPHFVNVPKDQSVAPGSTLTLTCRAVGNPIPIVFWKCAQTILRPPSSNATKEKGDATVILSDLSESLRCTCVAKNNKESIEHSIMVSIHEFSTIPINIQINNVMATSFTLAWWNRPTKNDNYIYQISIIRTEHLINGKNTTVRKTTPKMPYSDKLISDSIIGLSPFTNYTVWVEIIHPQEDYIKSNVLSFITLELPPSSAPKNIELSAISNGAVAVIWEPPEEANGIITAYNIYYTTFPSKALALWNKYTLKIEDDDKTKRRTSILSHLTNNVIYHICVSAQNSAGSGTVTESYPILVRAGVVQGPKQLRAVTKSATEIQLFWLPLVPRTNINILSYRIQYAMKSKPEDKKEKVWKYSPEQNQISIDNLQPNTTYNLQLCAITSTGNGMVSSVEATTYDTDISNNVRREQFPSAVETRFESTEEPIVLHGKALNSTAIEVSWILAKEMKNKVIYFRIKCHKVFPNETVSDKDFIDNYVKNNSIIDNQGHFSYIFKQLEPNTPYQIFLNAITRSVSGTTFKSKPILTWPKKIPKLQFLHLRLTCAMDRPCVELKWSPVADQKEWIKGYRIQFYRISDNEKVELKIIEKNVKTTQYETMSSDHYQGFRYEFRVAPYSKYEIGEESIGQIFILEGVPATSPSGFKMKDLSQNNPASVSFTWNKLSPQSLNGKFDRYELRCYIVNEEKSSETFYSTKSESIIIKNLFENKNYSCSVRVWNGHVSGPWTNPTFFKTKDAYLFPPEKIRMIRLSHSTAHITWMWKMEFPIYYSHFLIYYADEKSRSNLDVWSVKSTKYPFTKVALTDLNATISYVIRVASISKQRIEGPLSDIVKETSLGSESWPAKVVSQATCAPETSSNIQLRWSAEFKKIDLSHFRVNFTGVTTFQSEKSLVSLMRDEEEQSTKVDSYSQYITHQLKSLRPNTRYTISVEPIFLPLSIHIGGTTQIICTTLKEAAVSVPELSLIDIDKSNNLIHLSLQRPNYENGSIDIYYIIVASRRNINKYNLTRRKRALLSNNYLENLLSQTANTLESDSGPYIALSVKGEDIFPVDNSEKNTHIITIGTGKTIGTITNKQLNESIDYQMRMLACIRLSNFNKQTFQCTPSPWSKPINIMTSIIPRKTGPFVGPILPNTQANKGPSTFTMTTVVIILGIIILTVLSMSTFIILKRRNRLKSKLGIMYGTHSTRLGKEKSLCMDNLLKEPLVDSSARISTSESLRFSHHGNNYLDISKLQLSSTPDLLQRSSVNQPLTSVVLYHGPNGRGFEPEPIHVETLAEHVAKLKDNDGKLFCLEYESIEPGQQFTWNVSNMDINRPKNRYANVIAYDHCRVILQSLMTRKNSYSNETSVIPGSDYINANYIDGYMKPNAYIATQGPIAETIGDFWRMVWEQNSAVIVMMTRLEERDRAKCDQYWPVGGKGSIGTYSNINVTIMDMTDLAYYTIRKFHIQKYGCIEGRDIYQLQFTAWPDHGVPNHPAPLLMFLRRVQAENPRTAGPMIVHCSAGVGRTGAFIVIDYMLERLHYENTVDIYNYVTSIRAQRNYMVQTEEQYIFIHEALLEAVQCGNTEVPVSEIANHIETLNQIEITHRTADGVQMTGLQMEYEKLLLCSQGFIQGIKSNPNNHSLCSTPTTSLPSSTITSQPLTFDTANLPINQLKNRIIQMLPPDFSRVNLCPIRGVEGSDYINASWIDGYRTRKAYIASQSPLVNTSEDFWRMLWEHTSSIIVMLTRMRENNRERSYQYWPLQSSARYQFFIVDPVAEYNMSTFIIREFKITDTRDSQSRVIRQFHYTDWRESEGIPESTSALLDVIHQVHKTKAQLGLDGPITVHCSAGTGRTGIFIALSNILDRMKNESVIDLFQTVKLLRWQRPALIQSEDQYQFCYTAALEYLKIYEQMQFE